MSTDKNDSDRDEVALAKGAAREAIGKLIGDDAEVRAGRAQQAGAGDTPSPANGRTARAPDWAADGRAGAAPNMTNEQE
ncbi:CsbD family protein [Sphingomonas sp. MA1305]|uniref:hypothetical protein n=1 Tax=Sphingomonas sp. MA1305 TaxID=2479204 RepID=UPI0018DFB31E|nr:hypothetical protein [Sphingomonas sp. MA1305]MBI0476175.1 CsbD family protein [Sphingomonas sp. MA1305]